MDRRQSSSERRRKWARRGVKGCGACLSALLLLFLALVLAFLALLVLRPQHPRVTLRGALAEAPLTNSSHVDVKLHLSVHNPNKAAFSKPNSTALFYFLNAPFANGSIPAATIPPDDIKDLPIKFTFETNTLRPKQKGAHTTNPNGPKQKGADFMNLKHVKMLKSSLEGAAPIPLFYNNDDIASSNATAEDESDIFASFNCTADLSGKVPIIGSFSYHVEVLAFCKIDLFQNVSVTANCTSNNQTWSNFP